ncbi:unnamed protein product [Amoebophrya sp. A120]|nr:unnamed protein product [Amoebophrya sp. A120]|eukprot:GSA120T00006606001.1
MPTAELGSEKKAFDPDHFCCKEKEDTCTTASKVLYEQDPNRFGLVFNTTTEEHMRRGTSEAKALLKPEHLGSLARTGYFLAIVNCSPANDGSLTVNAKLRVKHGHGYLSSAGMTMIGMFSIFTVVFLGLAVYLLCAYKTWAFVHQAAFAICALSACSNFLLAALLHVFNASGSYPQYWGKFIRNREVVSSRELNNGPLEFFSANGTTATKEHVASFRLALLFLSGCLLLRGGVSASTIAALRPGEKMYAAIAAGVFFFWRLLAFGHWEFNQFTGLNGMVYTRPRDEELPVSQADSSFFQLPPASALAEVTVIFGLALYLDKSVAKARRFTSEFARNEGEFLADVLTKFMAAWGALLVSILFTLVAFVFARFAVASQPTLSPAGVIEPPSTLGVLLEQWNVVGAEVGEDVFVICGCLIIILLVPQEIKGLSGFIPVSPTGEPDATEDVEMVEAVGVEIDAIKTGQVWAEERFDDDEDDEPPNVASAPPRRLE